MITGYLSAIAGYLFMLSAPGNGRRFSAFGAETVISRYFQNFLTITMDLVAHLRLLGLIGILLLLAFLFAKRKEPFRKAMLDCLPVLVLLLGTAASLYAMIVVDYFPLRAWCGTVVLGIISCGYLFSQLKPSTLPAKAAVCLVMLVLIAVPLYRSMGTYRMLTEEMARYNARVESIQAQIDQGKTEIWIPRLTGGSKFSCFWQENSDIVDDPSDWRNAAIARYWGVDSIHKLP